MTDGEPSKALIKDSSRVATATGMNPSIRMSLLIHALNDVVLFFKKMSSLKGTIHTKVGAYEHDNPFKHPSESKGKRGRLVPHTGLC